MPLSLPSDRHRGTHIPIQSEYESQALPSDLTRLIEDFHQKTGIPISIVVWGALVVLVRRYCQEERVAIDCLLGDSALKVASASCESTVKAMIDVKLQGDPSFLELIRSTESAILESTGSTEGVVEVSTYVAEPLKNDSKRALAKVQFQCQIGPGSRSIESFKERLYSGVELILNVCLSGEFPASEVTYNGAIFDRNRIKRLLGHYQVILRAGLLAPDQRISRLPMLSSEECEQVLINLNRTETSIPEASTIARLFEEQVERNPNGIAIEFEDRRMSYEELNSRANQLAHYLNKREVGPEVIVAICMERSLDMVVGILGILKAGGAYLPLDVSYPQERLDFMLGDARTSLIVAQSKFQSLLAEISEGRPKTERRESIFLDSDWPAIAQGSEENPKNRLMAENLAYVIYTSGSTGKPKGVAIAHQSASALIHWAHSVFSEVDLQGVLASTSICFDLSVFEMFVPLTRGGKLILAENALALLSLPAREEISLVNTVPSAIAQLVREKAILASVRTVCLAGEPLSAELADAIYEQGVERVYDLFGPSEDTTYSTFALRRHGGPETVGRPVANTQIYLLDGHMQAMPIGVPGEMYIGGSGLARGYLNRPELTAERFVPNPFGVGNGARMYRTGDRARYFEGGNIEFLGRLDNQVKIRGFRIELGEIEAALKEHSLVSDAIVLARTENSQGRVPDQQLVAYITLKGRERTDPSQLQEFLSGRLPRYMIPTACIILDRMPLTPNGKIDRRALPQPSSDRPQSATPLIDPTTEGQFRLAKIWKKQLGLDEVGIDDHFIALGGHSLKALEIAAEIQEVFGIDLSLSQILQSPTIADLARKVEAQRLSESRNARHFIEAQHGCPARLSFGQERFWFLDQALQDRATYSVPLALHLKGRLNYDRIRQAFASIIHRHESLRTRFRESEGQPIPEPVESDEAGFSLEVEELDEDSKNPGTNALGRMLGDELRRPINIQEGPVWRIKLFRLGTEEHILLLNIHHIVWDEWSIRILLRELSELYSNGGDQLQLPQLPIQYVDFAVWQRNTLRGPFIERQRKYWTEQISGLPGLLELPNDRPRLPIQSCRGDYMAFEIPPLLTHSIRQLSRQANATLFMTLLAAFKVLLFRYTQRTDIVIGSPIAHRSAPEVQSLIGFFLNMLPFRSDLSGDPPFRQFIQCVRKTSLEAFENQDVPFDQIVEDCNLERSSSYSSLFQVLFVLFSDPLPELNLPGVEAEAIPVHTGTAKFDLSLELEEREDTLFGRIEYSTDLFNTDRIQRMTGHFLSLLEDIVEDPETRISQLSLLLEEERVQLLQVLNETHQAFPHDCCVHELFERQAEERPHAIAVEFEGQRLTYEQLNERANQLSHYLIRRGVGPEVIVGICTERSLEMLVGMLGILKAGGAYLPLDTSYPQERLDFMLEDAGACLILTQGKFESLLAEIAQARSSSERRDPIALDSDWPAIAQESKENPKNRLMAENLAYVIYTSGSTGKPKGVAIAHQSASALIHWAHSVFSEVDLQGVLASTSICFDLSVFEMFVPLTRGGKLILAENALALLSLPAREEISLVNTVPSAIAQLVREKAILASVRTVCLAGEPLSAELADAIYEQGVERVYDLFGPSEDTTYSTFALRRHGGPETVGRPVANTQIYLLDGHMQAMPIGVPGEMYIGGSGLARGYLNRPELTAERFVPNPFGVGNGARMYRTGDRARYFEGGNIEFLGRLDNQVKIRGFRIELGEIEAALKEHPRVNDAVVIARTEAPEGVAGDQQLVAYSTMKGQKHTSPKQLRDFLSGRLPKYMLPAACLILDQMPLTPNGKIDRKSLPTPPEPLAISDESFVSPKSDVEIRLAQIWEKLLGVERVGLTDSFFDLGGNSLKAITLLHRINERLHCDLSVHHILETPTISELAETVEASKISPETATGAGRKIGLVVRDRDLALSFAQARLYFLERTLTDRATYNISLVMRITGSLDIEKLENAVRIMVRRHEVLRTFFQERDSNPCQFIADSVKDFFATVDVEMLSPVENNEELCLRILKEEATRPFNLHSGPLFRFKVIQIDQSIQILSLTMHHIVSDEWSFRIFLKELSVLYRNGGDPAQLPQLPLQYADFAVWQREALRGPFFERQRKYWRKQLNGMPELLELPADRPRPPIQSCHGDYEDFEIPPQLTHSIRKLSQDEEATLFMTLLAAFKVFLLRYTQRTDIVVGSHIANRSEPEVQSLIGFFLNMLPLRSDLSGDPPFREVIHRVRKTCLEAIKNQDVPFDQIVEDFNPERSPSYSPLLQVDFVFFSDPLPEFDLTGVKAEAVPVHTGTAKFDLSLELEEREDRLWGRIEYRTDLFGTATILRMLGHYVKLLEEAVRGPEKRISEFPLMSAGEREQVLVEWNQTQTEFPSDCIHELFEEQVERDSPAVAVEFEGQQLSYED